MGLPCPQPGEKTSSSAAASLMEHSTPPVPPLSPPHGPSGVRMCSAKKTTSDHALATRKTGHIHTHFCGPPANSHYPQSAVCPSPLSSSDGYLCAYIHISRFYSARVFAGPYLVKPIDHYLRS